jgi:hydrogenase maturation protease
MSPLLIVAVGNPSRGDDALGPLLLDRLAAHVNDEVELLTDFQLQVEHALDLQGRQAVLFVDAAHPGHATQPVQLTRIEADAALTGASHALRPQAVLHVAQRFLAEVPPAWLLSIEGESFELGAGLSDAAQARLHLAEQQALQWLHAQHEALPCTS